MTFAINATQPASPSAQPLQFTLTRVDSSMRIAEDWRTLEQAADASFFISWSWIGPWLEMALRVNTELYLYRCLDAGQTVALAILSRTKVTRRRVFRSTTLALNEVPAKGLDMIIEYNDVLIRRGYEDTIRARFASDLSSAPIKWDELRLSGVPASSWEAMAKGNKSLTPVLDELRTPWATDISQINGDLDKLLAPLSRNRRWQIRRSLRAFQEDGTVIATTPGNCEEALLYFQAMGELHTQRWNRVGKKGSFASLQWVAFHNAVIREGFGRGEIQLLKITVADKIIGYVYSFIWRGTAYMLQTGFTQEEDNTKRPGIVSHCLAMQHNSTQSIHTYDYMCGDAEYKKILAQNHHPLAWGRIQRKAPILAMENTMIRIGRVAKKLASRSPVLQRRSMTQTPTHVEIPIQ